jgi:hypothetical protein
MESANVHESENEKDFVTTLLQIPTFPLSQALKNGGKIGV